MKISSPANALCMLLARRRRAALRARDRRATPICEAARRSDALDRTHAAKCRSRGHAHTA